MQDAISLFGETVVDKPDELVTITTSHQDLPFAFFDCKKSQNIEYLKGTFFSQTFTQYFECIDSRCVEIDELILTRATVNGVGQWFGCG